jgi:uncharacterized protein (TIGR00159 family)
MEGLIRALHLQDFGFRDFLEVTLLSVVIYRLFLLIKGTRAVQMLYGLLGLLVIFWLTGPSVLRLNTIHQVLVSMSFYIPIVIIVVFQNTIRRVLTGFGVNPLGRYLAASQPLEARLDLIVSAAYALASRRIGGLIVLEREQGLRNWIESGILLDAALSYDLIVNVFSPYTPLHDGALIIADGRLRAASCFLPLTNNPALSTIHGTRHRAGIGITEETDALSIIISEERGSVALAQNGVIHDALDKEDLRRRLREALDPPLRRRNRTDAAARSAAQGAPARASLPVSGPGPENEHGT